MLLPRSGRAYHGQITKQRRGHARGMSLSRQRGRRRERQVFCALLIPNF